MYSPVTGESLYSSVIMSGCSKSGEDWTSQRWRLGLGFYYSRLRYWTSRKPSTPFLIFAQQTILQPNGRDIPVTSENVNEYIAEVLDAIVGTGAAVQARAFREGFSKVFPVSDLRAFSADELVMLFGNSEEDWSVESNVLYVFAIYLSLMLSCSVVRSFESWPWLQRREQSHPRSDRNHVGLRSSYTPSISAIHHW